MKEKLNPYNPKSQHIGNQNTPKRQKKKKTRNNDKTKSIQ
jgi:hypothetical protein